MRDAALHVIYCEDARLELGNKISYMGVFGPILLVPGPTCLLDRIVVATILSIPAKRDWAISEMAVEVALHNVDGSVQLLQEAHPKPTLVEEDEWFGRACVDQGLEEPFLQAVGIVRLKDVSIDSPSYLAVRVITDAGEICGRPLLIAPSPEGGFDKYRRDPGSPDATKPKARKTKPKKKTDVILQHPQGG